MGKGNNNSDSNSKLSSVGVRVPSFLTVVNSPLTSSGTIDITYNNTPLPISSGGTGLTAVGSKGQILSVISDDPEQLGWVAGSGTGTVTSISMQVPEFLTVSPSTITSSGTFEISQSKPIPISAGGTNLSSIGQPNQILSVNSQGTELEYKFLPEPKKLITTTPFISLSETSIECSTIPISHGGTGLSTLGKPSQILMVNEEGTELKYTDQPVVSTTSISMTVPEFLTVSPSTITSSGTFDISLSKSIPISAGGTGLSKLGQPGQILSVNHDATEFEFTTPTEISIPSATLTTSTPFLSTLSNSNSLTIDCSIIPVSHGGTGLSTPGQENQILTSNGTTLQWSNPPNLSEYLKSIETMYPLSYSDNVLSISSYTGTGRIVYDQSPVLISPILGDASASSISLNGTESGSVKLSAKSGSYNFILPTTIGQKSQILTSQGPFLPTQWSSVIGSGDLVKAPNVAMKGQILSVIEEDPLQLGWIDGSGTGTVTSISMTVPEFLTVTPSAITSSGTFEISLLKSIPISAGGTGLSKLGLPGQILSVNHDATEFEFTTPNQGVTSISLSSTTPFITTSINPITTSGSLTIDCSTIPISYGGTGLSTLGTPNQVLTVNDQGTELIYSDPKVGVTSISMTVPEFLSVSPITITSSGTFEVSQIKPIPISGGGTGLSKLGQPGQILSVAKNGVEYEFSTPTEGTVTSLSFTTSTPFLSVSPNTITTSGTVEINSTTIPISYGGTGLSKPGKENQILTSNGTTLEWTDPPTLDHYLTSIEVIPPLQYSNNTISISSFTGSGKIVFDTSSTLVTPILIDPEVNCINIKGSQSDSKIQICSTLGDYKFILPTNYGKPGQLLTAQGPFNPMQWTSTTGSGDIVCSQNAILSGQTILTNGTVLCKSKIVQSQGITTITENTTLTLAQLLSVLIIDSENPITITLPSVKEIHDFISDFTIGNRISTIIQNKCPSLSISPSEGMTLIDGRSSSSLLVQEYTYVMTNADQGLLLVK